MDNLKKFVNENLDAFNIEEPSDLHFNNFESKLKTSGNKRRNKVIQFVITFSGAAILVFGYLFLFNTEERTICNPEVYEVASYYSSELESKLDELKVIVDKTDENTKEELLEQIEKFQDESDTFLSTLCSEDNTEKTMSVINMHYTTQMQVVTQLINLMAS